MAEVDFPNSPLENSNEKYKEDIKSLRKLVEVHLYSCELDKFNDDLCKVLAVDKSKYSESSNFQGKFVNGAEILSLLLKHIFQSKKFSILKEENSKADLSKHLLEFVQNATKRSKLFSLVDFLEGIATFLTTELTSLDESLEKNTKKISEATEYNLKRKSSLSCQIYWVLHCVLSSNNTVDFLDKAETGSYRTGLVDLIKAVIVFSRFPQHKDFKDICILDVNCMDYFHDNAFNCLKAVNNVLEWLCKMLQLNENNVLIKNLIKSFLKGCIDEMAFGMLQHINRHTWTSTETMVEAQNLLTFLCKLTYSEGIEMLLSGTENTKAAENALEGCKGISFFPNGIAELILENVCPKFFNGGWKRDISLTHIIAHVTKNIKFPNLKSYIKVIVPLLLEVIGDYKTENQILGIECLTHLIENVTASNLNFCNHGALIYQVLFKLLYGAKPPTLRVLLPCLHRALYVFEPFPERVGPNRPSKWDEILQKLISNMEYENCSESREILVSNLSIFMDSMGINCTRYLLSILKATSFCLEMYDNKDGRIRKQGLNVLKALVTTCWPVMWRYLGSLIKIILKVVVDTSMKGAVVEEDAKMIVKEKSKEILILLSQCCGPESVLNFIDNALEAEIGDLFNGTKEFLRDVKRDIELNKL